MKLKRIRIKGRYTNHSTGQTVNIQHGYNDNNQPVLFYIDPEHKDRVYISDREFYGAWVGA